MKIARYNFSGESTTLARPGAVIDEHMGDLRAGYARYLAEQQHDPKSRETAAARMPASVLNMLKAGAPALAIVATTIDYLRGLRKTEPAARGLDGEALFTPLGACRLHAPLRPGKLLAIGRNYPDPAKKMDATAAPGIPPVSMKAASCMIGPTRDIIKPAVVRQLDYEAELAIVIGQPCKNVPPHRAYEVIAGYIVVNDLNAREITRIERQQGAAWLGRNFDTFCPSGPWFVSRDEIADPMDLRIVTRVNGEVRQDGSTSGMIFSIPRLIAYVSQVKLEPGDIIATGTPAGSANERAPGQSSWYLQHGDLVECEVERIGTLRNKVADEPPGKETGWQW